MNTQQFEQLVGHYEAQLHAYARRRMRNHEDAEEVVQDTFVRAHRALCKMTADERDSVRLKAWLYAITRNVARSRLRKKSLRSIPIDGVEDFEGIFAGQCEQGPESMLERRASIERVEEALRRLPPALRPAARLRFLEGHTQTEIARIFKQPVGTVKSRVHRATLIMRRLIGSAP